MIDNLPREIIAAFSSYLSRQELCNCVRVCRPWNVAFSPVLYSSVDIRSERQFYVFLKTLSDTQPSNRLGYFVRKIKISYFFKHDDLTPLPYLCPYVVDFDFAEDWYPALSKVVQEWKYLTRMPSVIIRNRDPDFRLDFFQKLITRLTLGIETFPQWIELLVGLSGIEELRMDCDGREDGVKVSLSDLETLHGALPRIRSLKMNRFLIDGEMPEDIMPCDTVRELSLKPEDGHLWGQYFSKKYTRLEKLVLRICDTHREYLQPEALTLVKSCRQLKWFEASTLPTNFYGVYQKFLEVLRETGAPLTCLTVRDWDGVSYTSFVNGFCETLSKVEFYTKEEFVLKEILRPLKGCISLVELQLRVKGHQLEVDCILDHCKGLTTLDISGNEIRLTNKHTSDGEHGLRKLIIAGNDIVDEIFPYISQHCPHLSNLDCCYSGGCQRSPMISILNLDLKMLRVDHCNHPEYKLTCIRDSNLKRKQSISAYQEPIDEYGSTDRTRWYRRCLEEGRITIRKITRCDSFKTECIVSIIYHYIDTIYLKDAFLVDALNEEK